MKTSNNFNSYGQSSEMSGLVEQSYMPENKKDQILASPLNNNRKLTESKTVMNRQASVLDENRVVLYKKGKQIYIKMQLYCMNT